MMITGGAQAVNIIISIIRMKVLAVFLGPSGVGLLSVYNNLQELVRQAAGLGMSSSGVRQIASARGAEAELSKVRRVLLASHLIQGTLAMLALWLFRSSVSEWMFGNTAHTTEVILIGVAVLLSLMGAAQTALLQGLRRIADLGRVTVLAAIVGTIVGLLAVWHYGVSGLIWFVLVQPFSGLLVAVYFTRRLPKPTSMRPDFRELWEIWKPMARLGFAFMLGGLATSGTLLVVRSRIVQDLGLDAAGQFAAAWGISMTYVGFLLASMGADYYPRLTEVIKDHSVATRLINDQVQLGLAIGGPVLLLLIGLAPWVISLLYSPEFSPAATLLQWQTLGNFFKLASWPLGFTLAAAARGKTFLFVQLNFNIFFLLMLWPTLARFGIVAAGPSFAVAYMIHFVVLNMIVYRLNNFRWHATSLQLLFLHALLASVLLLVALRLPLMAAFISPTLALGTGVFGLRIVLTKIGPTGRLVGPLRRAYAAIGWPIGTSE
tara:strand:+ start:1764 stop:3233 length:1470 start_codon:yes stop_codon:yes gene_type:complete